jgi:hypothetical protein
MFKRTNKQLKNLAKLDKLMAMMASDAVYDEYIIVRGQMENDYRTI